MFCVAFFSVQCKRIKENEMIKREDEHSDEEVLLL